MPDTTDDILDALLGPATGPAVATPAAPAAPVSMPKVATAAIDRSSPFFAPCKKCSGTGSYGRTSSLGHSRCTACAGQGGKMLRTTAEERAKAAAKRAQRESNAKQAAEAAFAAAHPDAWAWIMAKAERNSFAAAMFDAIQKWGHLTERQLETVTRLSDEDKARAAEKAAREATAPVLDTQHLKAALEQALAKGLKKPVLRFEGFAVSMAPAHGQNAGALYVKNGSEYLGKIVGSKFHGTWAANNKPDLLATIMGAMADPVESAKAFGRRTGKCSCCGRTLTDPASVAAGIGPICAESFF